MLVDAGKLLLENGPTYKMVFGSFAGSYVSLVLGGLCTLQICTRYSGREDGPLARDIVHPNVTRLRAMGL